MEETRRRILEATIALHREQGIVATSYKDIARRADVGMGTVYHHFPNLDDLVMACGGRLLEITRPPTPEVFVGLRSRRARLERLVGEVFSWYERYPQWQRAICDADQLEVLARGVKRREALLQRLVAAALHDGNATTLATVRALIDFQVYASLVSTGLPTTAATATITDVLTAWLDRARGH